MAKKVVQTESDEKIVASDVETKESVSTEAKETKDNKKVSKKETKVSNDKVSKGKSDKDTKAKDKSKTKKEKKSLKKKMSEVWSELKKVSKPSFGKVVKNTCVVIAVVAICTLLLFGVDKLFSLLYDLLLP